MKSKVSPNGHLPHASGDSVADAQQAILFKALPRYFDCPEDSSEQIDICQSISEDLAQLSPEFDWRTVRVWFNDHRSFVKNTGCSPGGRTTRQGIFLLPDAISGLGRSGCPDAGGGGGGPSLSEIEEALAAFRPEINSAGAQLPFAAAPPRVPRSSLTSGARGAEASAASTVRPRLVGSGPLAGHRAPPNDSEYGWATTHTGFRIMMKDATAAGSLVDSILRARISDFESLSDFRFGNRTLPFGDGRPARLDLLVEADDGRYVMIELQTGAADCLSRDALLSAASVFQVQLFRRRESGGDDDETEDEIEDKEEDGDAPRAPVKRDVYVIQIVAYDSREASKEAGLEQHFEDDDAAISVENIDGIHLIQIELRRIGMSFPVAAEVALGWTKLEWWCYLLKFSGQFSEEEIKRCRGLGIPDGAVSGLAQLRRRFWSQRQRTRYLPEVNAIGPTFEALVRSPPERGNP